MSVSFHPHLNFKEHRLSDAAKRSHPVERSSFKEKMRVEEVDADRKKKKKESEEEVDGQVLLTPFETIAAVPLCSTLAINGVAEGKQAIASAAVLSQEIEALFEKMAATMILMNSSDEAETTLFIENPQSRFCGTRITIREFSTAPKVFNVEIASHSLAFREIQAHQAELLNAFHKGSFSFSVHRLRVEIDTDGEKPVFHRKDAPEEQEDATS
jgi:hypothetical protein